MFNVFYVIKKVSTADLRTGLISEIYLTYMMIVGLSLTGTPSTTLYSIVRSPRMGKGGKQKHV